MYSLREDGIAALTLRGLRHARHDICFEGRARGLAIGVEVLLGSHAGDALSLCSFWGSATALGTRSY